MEPDEGTRRSTGGAFTRARGALIFVLGGVLGGGLMQAWAARHPDAAAPAAAPRGNHLADAADPDAPSGHATEDRAVTGADLSERGVLHWLAVGGGADPSSTQVQLEQDLSLFAALAATGESPGAVLFAGGPGVRAVQVLDHATPELDAHTALREELGALLDPRPERDARYRIPTLKVDAPADASAVLALLTEQLAQPGPRLDVFVATHGDLGETPAENFVSLWGDSSFDSRELATALQTDGARRSARVMITACFGGGFADLAFANADATAGAARHGACGLFATSAEHESNGCDANPDRQAQQGYALHLLHALRGQGRDGQPVTGLDLDGNGQVGLLEAHTRARIASESIDLPSTTSERFLRSLTLVAAASDAPTASYATPEDDAVIAALGARVALSDEASVTAARVALEAQLDALANRIEEQMAVEDDAAYAVRLAIAARWPELLDPFRADFEATLRTHVDAITAVLDSPEAQEHLRLREESDRLLLEEDALRLRWVLLMRLGRAFETRRLAQLLAERAPSDPDRRHYEALLACERAVLGG